MGAFLTLLAGLLLAPGEVRAAGCGRHVAADAAFAEPLDRLLGDASAWVASLPTVPARKAPCSGPECSEGRWPEPTAPTPVAPTRAMEWADLAPSTISPRPGASAPVPDKPGGRPSRILSHLDRPPRPLA